MTFTYLIIHLLSLVVKIQATELYGSPQHQTLNCNFSPAYYRRDPDQYLWVDKIASFMTADNLDCTFLCSNEPKCYSFNMAAYSDSKGLYLCELLPTDKYRAKDKLNANHSFHHYSPWSPCESGPCKNGADCVPEYEMNSYHCDCEAGFCGTHCQHRENRSCSHIKACNPTATSGSYDIDPDGEGGVTPFTVHCDMTTNNGVGVTVVSHDSEMSTLVQGFGGQGSYSRDVHYSGASLSQLASLTSYSSKCEQFIKYECYHSRLLRNRSPYGWWVSRDGSKMTYWGGATFADDYKCACGVTNSCADTRYGCNCDANDFVYREDSGLLSNKSHLPVRQLRFGDASGKQNQHGNHTLGELKCYGIAEG